MKDTKRMNNKLLPPCWLCFKTQRGLTVYLSTVNAECKSNQHTAHNHTLWICVRVCVPHLKLSAVSLVLPVCVLIIGQDRNSNWAVHVHASTQPHTNSHTQTANKPSHEPRQTIMCGNVWCISVQESCFLCVAVLFLRSTETRLQLREALRSC